MENTMRGQNSPMTSTEKEELLALGIDPFIVDNTRMDTYDYIKIAQQDASKESRRQKIERIVERAKALIVRDYIVSHLSKKRCNELRAEIDNEMGMENPAFLGKYITNYEEKWGRAWQYKDDETLFKIAYALGAIAMNSKRTELLIGKYKTVKEVTTLRQHLQQTLQQKKAQAAALTSSRGGTIQRRVLSVLTHTEKQELLAHGFEQNIVDMMGKMNYDHMKSVWNDKSYTFVEEQNAMLKEIRTAKMRIARKFVEDMIPQETKKKIDEKQGALSIKNGYLPPNDYEAQWETASKNRDYETLYALAYRLEDANWHTELNELLEKEYDAIQEQREQDHPEAEKLYKMVENKGAQNIATSSDLTDSYKSATIQTKGEHNESTEPRAIQRGESEDNSQGRRGRDNASDVQERQGGANSQVGGADGRGHSADGHGDSVSGRTSSSNDTVPGGRVSVSELDDRAGGTGVREGNLPQGGVAGQLQEPASGVQQPIDGHGLDFADIAAANTSTEPIQKIAYATFRVRHPEWTKQLDNAEEHIKAHGCQMPAEVMLKGNAGVIIAATEDTTRYKIWGFSPNVPAGILPINGEDGASMITQDGAEGLSELILKTKPNVQEKEVQPPRTRGEIAAIREQCREILKKDDSDITDADKTILSQYEGGGGIKQEKDRSVDAVLNEFYTPRNVIDKVWELTDYYVPDANTVLEPTSGIGRFAEGREQNKITLREIDATSARIARLLHPAAEVIQGADWGSGAVGLT